MATKNRVFVAFAIEDERVRDLFIGQAKNEKAPFEFVDMSVKEPWDSGWKERCRTRIKGCDGVIALVSKNTANAAGQLWEIKCAKEEKIPLIGVYTTTNDRPWSLPAELSGVKVIDWKWDLIGNFIDSL